MAKNYKSDFLTASLIARRGQISIVTSKGIIFFCGVKKIFLVEKIDKYSNKFVIFFHFIQHLYLSKMSRTTLVIFSVFLLCNVACCLSWGSLIGSSEEVEGVKPNNPYQIPSGDYLPEGQYKMPKPEKKENDDFGFLLAKILLESMKKSEEDQDLSSLDDDEEEESPPSDKKTDDIPNLLKFHMAKVKLATLEKSSRFHMPLVEEVYNRLIGDLGDPLLSDLGRYQLIPLIKPLSPIIVDLQYALDIPMRDVVAKNADEKEFWGQPISTPYRNFDNSPRDDQERNFIMLFFTEAMRKEVRLVDFLLALDSVCFANIDSNSKDSTLTYDHLFGFLFHICKIYGCPGLSDSKSLFDF